MRLSLNVDLKSELQSSLEAGIINGSLIAKLKRREIAQTLETLHPNSPYLVTVLVGDDPASQIYVSYKEKACNEIGIRNTVYRLEADITQMELDKKIMDLNNDDDVNGILLQLPLPKHLDAKTTMNKIHPDKDVDGLTYISVGKLHSGLDGFVPCTPAGVMVLFEFAKVDLTGKLVVMIGRSNLVGKPLARLLEQKNATVTLCHSRTRDIKKITNQADIVISAIGKAKFVTEDMIAENSIVIDVGTNRVDKKLYGDVDFENVSKKASLITPVPGGVGPMTITMLLYNTVKAYQLQNKI